MKSEMGEKSTHDSLHNTPENYFQPLQDSFYAT